MAPPDLFDFPSLRQIGTFLRDLAIGVILMILLTQALRRPDQPKK